MSGRIIEVYRCADGECPYFDKDRFGRPDYCLKFHRTIRKGIKTFPNFCGLTSSIECPKCGNTGWDQHSYFDGIPTKTCTCPMGVMIKGNIKRER